MKEKLIHVLCVEDDEGEVSVLCAFDKNENPNCEAVKEQVYDFLGEIMDESEEEDYNQVIEALCNHTPIEMYGYQFYFTLATFYETI